jgi:protease IV
MEVIREEAVKQENNPNPKLKKNIRIWLIIIVAVFAAAAIFQYGMARLDPLGNQGKDYAANTPYIGILYIEGVIMDNQTDSFGLPVGYQHQWTLSQIDDLIADDKNTGLILFVNSPGGGVYESDELYLKLKEYKEVTGRPVYSAMGSMAASGGYYISAAADKIVANRNCWTGSIGVTIGTFYDISEFLANNGVKSVTITSGANKAMGSMTKPMTTEQLAIFQALVDESYDQFTGIVAEGRKMDLNLVRKLADGRIYTAKQALALGLIDGIGTLDETITDMQTTYDLNDSEAIDITYQDDSFLGRMLSSALPNIPMGDTSAILELVKEKNNIPISYMFNWQ